MDKTAPHLTILATDLGATWKIETHDGGDIAVRFTSPKGTNETVMYLSRAEAIKLLSSLQSKV